MRQGMPSAPCHGRTAVDDAAQPRGARHREEHVGGERHQRFRRSQTFSIIAVISVKTPAFSSQRYAEPTNSTATRDDCVSPCGARRRRRCSSTATRPKPQKANKNNCQTNRPSSHHPFSSGSLKKSMPGITSANVKPRLTVPATRFARGLQALSQRPAHPKRLLGVVRTAGRAARRASGACPPTAAPSAVPPAEHSRPAPTEAQGRGAANRTRKPDASQQPGPDHRSSNPLTSSAGQAHWGAASIHAKPGEARQFPERAAE